MEVNLYKLIHQQPQQQQGDNQNENINHMNNSSNINNNIINNNNNNNNERLNEESNGNGNGNDSRIVSQLYVRKCSGKNRLSDCLQGSTHPNTRWECSFCSTNREEYLKHCKNISKRGKWKDLVEQVVPDKDSLYRCVYFATDRCHVENHYDKASSASEFQFSNGLKPKQLVPRGTFVPRNNIYAKGKRSEFDGDERDFKKMRQDASLLQGLSWAEHGNSSNDADSVPLPDTMKTEELLEQIEKKLHLPHEMITSNLEKLITEGFIVIGPLRSLKREGWTRLSLPIALEDELKTQLANKIYNPYYVPGSPLWSGSQGNVSTYWPHQGAYGEPENSQKEHDSDEVNGESQD